MGSVAAAVIPGPGQPVEVREFPEPELEHDSAVLEVELSEVCGTDVHLRDGRLEGVPYPLIPGHVAAGRLAKVRGIVRDVEGWPLAEGDRVTFLDVHGTCNECWYCLVAKASTRCPSRRVYGITYGAADGLCGGWAERMYLKPGTRLIRLTGVEPETFMAGGCSLPTALHAVERADIQFADTVLVLGSGPVGLSAVILARMRGAGKVLCIGAPESRLVAARAVGATATLPLSKATPDQRLDWVLEHTGGRGADVTIEAAGTPEAVPQALRFTRDAGRVVVVGQYTDHGSVEINPHTDLNRKHLDVRGTWGSDFSHFYRGVQLLKDSERARPWTLISPERFGLHEADAALQAVAEARVTKAFIDPHRTP